MNRVFYLTLLMLSLSGCGVGLDTSFSGGSQRFLPWPKTVEDGVSGDTIGNDNCGHGIAVDSSGNVYVVNYTTFGVDGQALIGTQDYFLTKYGVGGVRQWTIEDGVSGGAVDAYGVVLDSSGNIYVSGTTNRGLDGQTLLGTKDFFLTKYNSSGVRQWTVEDGASAATIGNGGLAVDLSGNLYLVGSTNKALDGQTLHGNTDLFITKYGPNGNRIWTVEDGTLGAGVFLGPSVAVDSSGNVDVLGSISAAALDGQTYYGHYDYFLTQYNSSGVRQWTAEDGANSTLYIFNTDVTVDLSGNIYISGLTQAALDGQTEHGSSDLFLSQYTSSGNRQWTIQDGSSGSFVYGRAVTTDSPGNVYVSGYTLRGLDGNAEIGTQDYFISKYSANGSRQWSVEDGTSGAVMYGGAMVSDIFSNLYMTGITSVSGVDGNPLIGTWDYFVSQYSSSGVRE